LRSQGTIKDGEGRFKFVTYERNEDVENVKGSSVSYASAYAIL
jgi:predicted class III extradiol MEMO1 family dioxygenase